MKSASQSAVMVVVFRKPLVLQRSVHANGAHSCTSLINRGHSSGNYDHWTTIISMPQYTMAARDSLKSSVEQIFNAQPYLYEVMKINVVVKLSRKPYGMTDLENSNADHQTNDV